MIGVRQLGLSVSVVAGLVALSLLGGPVSQMAPVAILLCLLAPIVRGKLQRIPWPLITGPVMIGITLWLWRGGDRQQSLGLALMYLQVHRSLARRVAADDRVTVLLSGLMIVACASSTEDPIFLGVMVFWALALPVALLPHLTLRARGGGRVCHPRATARMRAVHLPGSPTTWSSASSTNSSMIQSRSFGSESGRQRPVPSTSAVSRSICSMGGVG